MRRQVGDTRLTYVLASFCNQGLGRQPLGLVDLDTGLSQPLELDGGDAFTCTGVAPVISVTPDVLADSVVTGTCGITVVDPASFEILDFVNLEHLSAEIYDLLPLDRVVRPPGRPWHSADTSSPGRTPVCAINPMLDGPPRPVDAPETG